MLVGAVLFLAGTAERIRDEWIGASTLLGAALLSMAVGAYMSWREHD